MGKSGKSGGSRKQPDFPSYRGMKSYGSGGANGYGSSNITPTTSSSNAPLTDGNAGSFQINKDGSEAQEYHGKGYVCNESGSGHNHPVGGIHFDDSTESGKHSHQSHSIENGTATQKGHRDEGHNQPWVSDKK